jgi:hypothetical protein
VPSESGKVESQTKKKEEVGRAVAEIIDLGERDFPNSDFRSAMVTSSVASSASAAKGERAEEDRIVGDADEESVAEGRPPAMYYCAEWKRRGDSAGRTKEIPIDDDSTGRLISPLDDFGDSHAVSVQTEKGGGGAESANMLDSLIGELIELRKKSGILRGPPLWERPERLRTSSSSSSSSPISLRREAPREAKTKKIRQTTRKMREKEKSDNAVQRVKRKKREEAEVEKKNTKRTSMREAEVSSAEVKEPLRSVAEAAGEKDDGEESATTGEIVIPRVSFEQKKSDKRDSAAEMPTADYEDDFEEAEEGDSVAEEITS